MVCENFGGSGREIFEHIQLQATIYLSVRILVEGMFPFLCKFRNGSNWIIVQIALKMHAWIPFPVFPFVFVIEWTWCIYLAVWLALIALLWNFWLLSCTCIILVVFPMSPRVPLDDIIIIMVPGLQPPIYIQFFFKYTINIRLYHYLGLLIITEHSFFLVECCFNLLLSKLFESTRLFSKFVS